VFTGLAMYWTFRGRTAPEPRPEAPGELAALTVR
jgi:hypothetical protein